MARGGKRRAARPGRAQRGPVLAAKCFPETPRHGDGAHRSGDRVGAARSEGVERTGGEMDRGATEGTLLIELGGRTVEYRFTRRRRRTLGITVDAQGLRVAAPLRAPWREIEGFLQDKERWILRKLDEWARMPRGTRLHGTSGELLPVFGVPHVLELRHGRRHVESHDGRVVIT